MTSVAMAFFTLTNRDLQIPSATLRIRGPDANTYLQGQFTQELRLPAGRKCYGLWLNQKGKVLADSYILKEAENAYWVHAPRTTALILRERLESYLIADEVEMEDFSTHWSVIYLTGDDLGAAWTALGLGNWPEASCFASAEGWKLFSGCFTGAANYVLLVSTETVAAWVARLRAAGWTELPGAELERRRILARQPAVPDDVGPTDLPNEGGLEQEAISYTKGCYLGQEVMARLKNLGQVRRKLHVVRGPGEPPPRAADLFQGAQRVGEIRSAARDGDGFVALAMLSLVTLQPSAPLSLTAGGAADIVIHHG